MDDFEKFLKENRLRLDTENFDSSCWNNIDNAFRQSSRKRLLRSIYIAATLVVIISFSTVIYLTRVKQRFMAVQTGIFNGAHADLAKQEKAYMLLIDSKLNDIKKQKIPAQYKDLFNDFIKQLQRIDKQYDLYKSVVEKHGYNEEIIQQIIFYYQLKLSVLQMLQSEMTKINNLTKTNKHENKKLQLDI